MHNLLSVLSKRNTPEQVEKALSEYAKYLLPVRHNLPLSAYEFASAPWHYDHTDHRCPHDSWLESVTISEPASGAHLEFRHIEISMRLFGAFHDGYLELSYPSVQSYSLSGASGISDNAGHGDWLVDEIRLSDRNLVHHEILFGNGSRWLIESMDVKVSWVHL